MSNTIVLATHNKGKIREFKEVLLPLGYDVCSVYDILPELPEPEETGKTFAENAFIKASYMQATGKPCLADDSGIIADALGDRPGVYSARYAGEDCDDEKNNQKLVAELAAYPPTQRTAHYMCVLVLLWPDGHSVTATGTCEGIIRDFYAGTGGFGYDPLFYLPEYDQTMAELSLQEKNKISHRGRALRKLVELLP
jgi:XTP/dITP diphosphohydrolase